MIAQRSPREYLRIVRSQSGRQDSNLRPSAPKALNSSIAALGFQAIAYFCLVLWSLSRQIKQHLTTIGPHLEY